jgi:hypothetical protein
VIDEEFKALEMVYAATTTTVPYHLPTHDDNHHKKPQDPLCVNVGEAMESSSSSERLVPGLAADVHTGTGTGTVEEAGNYVQVVVDCDSLKVLSSPSTHLQAIHPSSPRSLIIPYLHHL